ncbi:condensation domain-containing protein, partial [Nocardia amamiensis]|uniref:condensation domain-containing protein n=1 Tax=Nocardia amamiensis TaxID=404578 RepID=UPI0014715C19
MDGLDFGGNDEAVSEVVSTPASKEDLFPLSPAQLGIWYAQHVDPQVPINIAQYVDLHGDLDLEVLREALIRSGHDRGSGMLCIVELDGTPYQWVDYTIPDRDKVYYVDFRGEADPAAAAMAWMRAEYSAPLDLLKDRLMRFAGLQIGGHHWYLYLRSHHIALDGFGAVTNLTRVTEHYMAILNGTEAPPAKAVDLYTLYEQEIAYRESTRFTSDKEYWAER